MIWEFKPIILWRPGAVIVFEVPHTLHGASSGRTIWDIETLTRCSACSMQWTASIPTTRLTAKKPGCHVPISGQATQEVIASRLKQTIGSRLQAISSNNEQWLQQ